MVCALSSDGPRATGVARIVLGLQADSPAHPRTVRPLCTDGPTDTPQRNFDTLEDLRTNSQELDEHTKNTHHAEGPWAAGGQSSSPRIEQPEVKNEKSTSPYPSMDLPNGVSS
jgi:hypothetical protein